MPLVQLSAVKVAKHVRQSTDQGRVSPWLRARAGCASPITSSTARRGSFPLSRTSPRLCFPFGTGRTDPSPTAAPLARSMLLRAPAPGVLWRHVDSWLRRRAEPLCRLTHTTEPLLCERRCYPRPVQSTARAATSLHIPLRLPPPPSMALRGACYGVFVYLAASLRRFSPLCRSCPGLEIGLFI